MKRIMIGEEQEYIRRLSDYMLRHMPADVRVYSFTTVDHMLDYEEEADIYILGVDFYKELIDRDASYSQKDIILLADSVGEGDICKWDSPAKLVEIISDRLSVHTKVMTDSISTELIALYTPCAGFSLRDRIRERLSPGDLYLGLEDIGSSSVMDKNIGDDRTDMGELCYYIRLRDEDILEKLHKMVFHDEAGSFLDSPRWYFDFLGLGEEDYQWFYDRIRGHSGYRKVYIGIGNAAISSMEYFQLFDRLILFDVPRHPGIHDFCESLAHTVVEEGYMSEESVEIIS